MSGSVFYYRIIPGSKKAQSFACSALLCSALLSVYCAEKAAVKSFFTMLPSFLSLIGRRAVPLALRRFAKSSFYRLYHVSPAFQLFCIKRTFFDMKCHIHILPYVCGTCLHIAHKRIRCHPILPRKKIKGLSCGSRAMQDRPKFYTRRNHYSAFTPRSRASAGKVLN